MKRKPKTKQIKEKHQSEKRSSRTSVWIFLTLTIVLALYLRLVGIGRPEPINYHADEWNLAEPIMRLANSAEGGLIYRYNWSGCGYIRVVGYGLYALKGWFGPYSYDGVLITLRVLSAVAGAATVLMAFVLLRKLASVRAALLGAALLAVAKLPVLVGHYGTLDSVTSLVVLAVMWLAYELFEMAPHQDQPRLKFGKCCLVGLLCGWGVATKWTIMLAAIPIAVALLQSFWAHRKAALWRSFVTVNLKRIGVIAGFSALSFLAALPDLQIAPQKVISGFTYEAKHHRTGHRGAVLEHRSLWSKTVGRTYKTMQGTGSLYVFWAGLVAVTYAVLRRTRGRMFLLLTLLLWMSVVLRNVVRPQRHYLIPFIIGLMLMGIFFDELLRKQKRFLRVGGAVTYAVLFVLATLYTCICISPFCKPDARVLCSKWIKANVPEGSGVTWAPRTPKWAAPGNWVEPSLFKTYPRKAQPGKNQYIIACRRTLNIFKKHPPTKRIVPREWFPTKPPSREEVMLYAEMNAGGGRNLELVKEFFAKPSFLGFDLRLFGLDPNTDTTFANQSDSLYRMKETRQ